MMNIKNIDNAAFNLECELEIKQLEELEREWNEGYSELKKYIEALKNKLAGEAELDSLKQKQEQLSSTGHQYYSLLESVVKKITSVDDNDVFIKEFSRKILSRMQNWEETRYQLLRELVDYICNSSKQINKEY